MRTTLLLRLCLPFLLVTVSAFAQEKIMQPGTQFHGIRDYREVMPGSFFVAAQTTGAGLLIGLNSMRSAMQASALLFTCIIPGSSVPRRSAARRAHSTTFTAGGKAAGAPPFISRSTMP